MNTKVTGAEKRDGKVFVKTEAAKDGKEDVLEADVVLVSVGRRPVTQGLNLEKIGIEVDPKGGQKREETREEVDARLDGYMREAISLLTLQMEGIYNPNEEKGEGLKLRMVRRGVSGA